ncbi:MAG: glycosyltransferase family 2 protein [Planctomycetia bacterium]|nr:glycosyltransferase family 2 protein [Planctomycetia bacterium]
MCSTSDLNAPLVSIVVCTFRRPRQIGECLDSLVAQETPRSYEIVVVENDVSQESRSVVESRVESAQCRGVEVRYVCEPKRGLAPARNRCVAEARGEFIAFLDDDETAQPDWLEQLMRVQNQFDADAVYGVVEPIFAENFPEYLKRTQLYSYLAPPTKEPYPTEDFCTNTVLLRKSALDRTPVFDDRFSRIGLEDTDLAVYFLMNARKTYRAPLAIVREFQPLSRGRWFYHFERWMRCGVGLGILGRKNFGRIAGAQFLLKRCARLWRFVFDFSRWCRECRANLADISFEIAIQIGFVLYFLGIRWKGY